MSFIKGDAQDLVLPIGSTYDRLLVHGSSQFHELKLLTIDVPIDASGMEVETCILIRKTKKILTTVAFNLPWFIKRIKHVENGGSLRFIGDGPNIEDVKEVKLTKLPPSSCHSFLKGAVQSAMFSRILFH